MEEEIRFYFGYDKYEELLEKLKKIKELENEGCYLELTIQYDHPNQEMSFYDKKVDGRFRLRSSINIENNIEKSKISWKRRIGNENKNINVEEEIEVELNKNQVNNLQTLLEQVLKMKRIESYQRYRNVFFNSDVEIVVDKYPFGIALEIENKSKTKNGEDIVNKWAKELKLNIEERYKLSWDDKYTSLCKKQGITPVKDVIFDENIIMPKL